MKTKIILTMAALALMMIACSNDDFTEQPIEQPVDNNKEITITATLAPKGNDGMRAVSDKGTYIESKWKAGEHLAILYTKDGNQIADAEILSVDGTGAATITFSVLSGTADNTNCQIVYPLSAAKSDKSGVKAYADMLATQDGVLDGDLDVRVGVGKIQVTTPGLDVTTQPAAQYSIFKFTVKNVSNAAKNATEFKVSDNSGNVITTVTPGSATGTLYVALPALATGLYWFNATIDSKAYIANANISTATTTGKYYQSTIKFATIGDVILSNGKFATKGTSGEQAVIAYVGKVDKYFDKFLALALTDANGSLRTLANAQTDVNTYAAAHAITIGSTAYDTNTTSTYYDVVADNYNTTSATSTAKQTGWRIPSVTDWRYILDGICTQMNGVNLWARSYDLSYSVSTVTPTNPLGISDRMSYTSHTHSSYNALKSACGNTALKNDDDRGYWSSSQYSGSSRMWEYNIYDGVFAWCENSGSFYVRACFAF